jgi:subtilase family serine protease
MRFFMKRFLAHALSLIILLATFVPIAASTSVVTASPALTPLVSDWQFLAGGVTPPTQTACNAVGRRCFNPDAMHHAYNYASLLAAGNEGQGKTIAIVDSFGSDTIRNDLYSFSTQFGLPVPCGANPTSPSTPDGNCAPGVSPRFDILTVQGGPPATPPPPNQGTGQESRNIWALEVSLDVEWAHATAPLANILLVTTPTAETLGVQGFQQMMNAEQYVVDHHLADVISQSFGSGEGAFQNGNDISNLRNAFVDAQANHVTVFASSGDGGTTNPYKEPVKNPATIPYPSIIWPASDPLVTAVGGTYLCTDATTGTSVDSVSPPGTCQANPGAREVGWVDGGGGYSTLFSRPAFQNTLPAGSTFVGSSVGAPGVNTNMRGIPDISYQASSRTGVLVYMTESNTTNSAGTGCGGANPCESGWYVVGGTSSGSPQWAGLLALTDQMAGRDLGYINPALYQVASNPTRYANDFFDITLGNNQTSSIPGYSASPGWDAVTGLGSPNVAHLIPDLIAATS